MECFLTWKGSTLWGWWHFGTLLFRKAGSAFCTQPARILDIDPTWSKGTHKSSMILQISPTTMSFYHWWTDVQVTLPFSFFSLCRIWGSLCFKCKPILSRDTGLSTDLLSCLLLPIIATQARCFYRKSLSLHIWLLPECFLLPPFLSCLPCCWCWDKCVSHSQQLIECDFWAGRGTDAVTLASPKRVFYSPPLSFSSCPTSPSSSLPFLADL